jgi:catalase
LLRSHRREKGSADTREIPEVLPIITEDGNWDLVGNTPVFSLKTARNLVILFTLKKGTPYQYEITNDDVGFLVTKSREFASGIDINV